MEYLPPELWYIIFKLRYRMMWLKQASRIPSGVINMINALVISPLDNTWIHHNRYSNWTRVPLKRLLTIITIMFYMPVGVIVQHTCFTPRLYYYNKISYIDITGAELNNNNNYFYSCDYNVNVDDKKIDLI